MKWENVEAKMSVVKEEVVKVEDKEVVVVMKSNLIVVDLKLSMEVLRALKTTVEGKEVKESKDEVENKTVNVVVV